MKALSIALKDLQIFFRNRSALVDLFVLPVVFILIFVGLSSATQTPSEAERLITLPIVNLDLGGATAQALIDALDETGGIAVQEYDPDETQALLEEAKMPRTLTIPAGFTADIAAGRPATLRLVSSADANAEETESVRLVVEGVARDMALQAQIIASLEQMGEMQAASPPEAQAFTTERVVAQARNQFERAKAMPLVTVEQTIPGALRAGDEIEFNAVQFFVPGFTVLFVFLAAQTTARSIYDEKRSGSFRRLLAAPMRKAALLAGKLLPNLITALIQIVVIFGVGVFVLPVLGLGQLTLGGNPLALALVSVLVALCSTSLGIVIAAIARTDAQIGGVSTLILWVLSLVGGAVVPVYLLSDTLNAIGKVTPQYWALQAYNDLLVRGQGLADIATEMAVLLGFSLVFFAFGLWRFDFD